GRNLVIVHRRVELQPELLVEHSLLEKRVAQSLNDYTVQLTLGERGIDDASGVVRGDNAEHAHLTRLDIDLNLCELRAKGRDGRSIRVRTPIPVSADHQVAKLLAELRKRDAAIRVAGAND